MTNGSNITSKGGDVMQIHDIPVLDLHEYENNPRNNDGAVEAVAESIKEFGFKVPLVVRRKQGRLL